MTLASKEELHGSVFICHSGDLGIDTETVKDPLLGLKAAFNFTKAAGVPILGISHIKKLDMHQSNVADLHKQQYMPRKNYQEAQFKWKKNKLVRVSKQNVSLKVKS